MAKTEWECAMFSSIVRTDLAYLGLIEQMAKSFWKPSQKLTWLGTIIDLLRKLIIVPQEKQDRTIEALRACLNRTKVTARQLCKAAGLINSLALVIGNKAVIKTKQFYLKSKAHVKTRFHWDNRFRMAPATASTVMFWIRELEAESFECSIVTSASLAVAFSDASAVAGAAVIESIEAQALALEKLQQIDADKMFAQNWNKSEQQASSTWREVKTIEQGLLAFREKLTGKKVIWFTDSLPGVSVVRKDSMKADLNPLSANIAEICKVNKIDLTVNWIRCTENVIANRLSRFVDVDDWGIADSFFQEIQREWCTCEIDQFASAANKKLELFNSKYLEEGCEAVDCFSTKWRRVISWLVPPPVHIPKVIRHLRNCRAKGIMVFPR